MRRRRSFGSRRTKRSVGWIDGITAFTTGGTNLQSRLISMAPLTTGSTTQAAAISVTLTEDLQSHGGEDAVLERIRGRFLLWNARQNVPTSPAAVVGGFVMRVVLAATDVIDPSTSTVAPDLYLDSAGLGRDNILWYRDVLVSGSNLTGTGGTGAAETSTINDFWFDIDVRAKRKLQNDKQIVIWFQTQVAALTPNLDFRMLGGMRTLLKRPR